MSSVLSFSIAEIKAKARYWGFCVLLCTPFLLFSCLEQGPASVANQTASKKYVGDAACASCHEGISSSFERTGMGRSLSIFDPGSAPEQFPPGFIIEDPNSALRYTAFVKGDTLFQREWVESGAGELISDETMPVSWVVGSGNATRSYLINVNGFVTEAPLTWYVDKEKWDLSPGYAQMNQRFSRPVNLECMTCHNSIPEHTPFTLNHYTVVPLGIGCERCHGPSSEHVERQLSGFDIRSDEIVNPARLGRARQLAICQQCHLTGFSAFQPGQDPTTFRPGTLLDSNRVVFEEVDPEADENSFGISSHASQLGKSECFVSSSMTCTTCHDPHVPVSDLGADSYNVVCANCHEGPSQTLCARPLADESQRVSGDCVSCHMQKGGTSDIPHVSFTDHWIRGRLPQTPPVSADELDRVRAKPMRLVRLGNPQSGQRVGREQLEEAIAFFELYETMHRHPKYLDEVLDRATAGIDSGNSDPTAHLALARAYLEQGRNGDATRELGIAVERYPENALLWYWLGTVRAKSGDIGGALTALDRAIAIQPLFVDALSKRAEVNAEGNRIDDAIRDYQLLLALDPVHHPKDWNNMGFLMLQSGQVDAAIPPLSTAARLDPLLIVARTNLGSAYLIAGRLEEAVSAFETVLGLDPGSVPAMGNLGIAYQKLGQPSNARAILQRLLLASPGDQNALRLLRELDEQDRPQE